jgi:hypothetical protein
LWSENNQQSFQSKFVFVLLITFGLTLFSCVNETDKNNIKIISEIINQSTNQFIEKTDTIEQAIKPKKK